MKVPDEIRLEIRSSDDGYAIKAYAKDAHGECKGRASAPNFYHAIIVAVTELQKKLAN